MFEVGQKVWDIIAGEGTVLRTNGTHTYPVRVKFTNGDVCSFTPDGKGFIDHTIPSLYPYPVEVVKKITKPSIDWNHVHSKFKWVAQDSDGGCWLYEEEPIETIDGWKCTKGDCAPAEGFISLTLGTCDWNDSLVARPEGA